MTSGKLRDDWDVLNWTQLRVHRSLTFAAAILLICVIGGLDFVLPRGIPLVLAYIFPIALVGAVSGRGWTVAVALLCTTVSELTDAYVWNISEGSVRDFITFIAFASVGLYVREFVTNQELEHIHLQILSDENTARVAAEEQLTLLIGSSALAILTMTDGGNIVQANDAASKMFLSQQDDSRDLVGYNVETLLPSFAKVLARSAEGRNLRTMMQAQGKRLDGDIFLAEVWFSNYSTSLGKRTSAMIVDISEEFRTREESIAEQLLSNSRLTLGAISHEIRNLSGAIQLVLQSLSGKASVTEVDADARALRELLVTLEKMAASHLSQVKRNVPHASLNQFMTELRVVAHAILSENEIAFIWDVEEHLPSVCADPEGLMQVFLNLMRNATSALKDTADPKVYINSKTMDGLVIITVSDNGPGISNPSELFRPFRGENVTGLGLYLSRSIMENFRGDLQYVPSTHGAHFAVELEVVR